MILLGGPVFGDCASPGAWVEAHRRAGYAAAYFPLDWRADPTAIDEYASAARSAGLVIAEVGAWSNPLSPDPKTRADALEHCKGQLELAERVGALCCVNIAGSCAEKWDGPDARDLTPETFARIVETVREILDAVQPVRTFYTLEPMPWMYPDDVESYRRLLRAVDRPGFAVHFDPVNLICSPQRYFRNGDLIREFVQELGPWIKSCHAKDILLEQRLTTHLNEVRPGLGCLDYRTFLEELERLPFDVPLMLEHLEAEEDYAAAAAYVRSVARLTGVTLAPS